MVTIQSALCELIMNRKSYLADCSCSLIRGAAAIILGLGFSVIHFCCPLSMPLTRRAAFTSSANAFAPVHQLPDAPPGYMPIGVVTIDGQQMAAYKFENGADLTHGRGDGKGVADVFDGAGHLVRSFVVCDKASSPPLVIEYLSMPTR